MSDLKKELDGLDAAITQTIANGKALMDDIRRLRSVNSDLLAALESAEGRLMTIDAQRLPQVAPNDDVLTRIRAAISRARGQA